MAGALKPVDVSTKRQRIAELAENCPDMAFTNLAHHIDLDWLRKAYDLSPSDTCRSAYAAILLDGIEAKLPNRVELSEQLARLAK